eukprot:2027827-Alexandrium_andersonii.AAC.1
MSAPSQLCRAMREARGQYETQWMLVLFSFPDTLHPACMSVFNAVLPDLFMVVNKCEAEIFVCAKPACDIWSEAWIQGVMGIWGDKEVDAGLRGIALRWATA